MLGLLCISGSFEELGQTRFPLQTTQLEEESAHPHELQECQ
jgi:hypothetical protein